MKKYFAFVLLISSLMTWAQVPSGCGSQNWPSTVLNTGAGSAFNVPAGSGTGWTYRWIVTSNLTIVSGQGTTTAYIKGITCGVSGTVYVTRYKDGVSACSDMKPVSVCDANLCNYTFSISDNYIDGTQSGSNTVGLNVSGGNNFPSGTTYSWTITRQDGSFDFYPASTAQTRTVTSTFDNRITDATVVATYQNCTKIVSKKFMCAIPHSDMYGQLYPDCQGLPGAKMSTITVGPNPTKSSINFEGENLEDYKISIFNFNGIEVVKSIKLRSQISLEKEKSGIYYYIITNDKGYKKEGKIIKE